MDWSSRADWQQFMPELRARWERLSDDDAARIDGDRARLIATLIEVYGWTPEEAETEVANWERALASAPAHGKVDAVARASAESFPASDPPGWIKQAPRAPSHAGPPPRGGAEQPAAARGRQGGRKR